MTAHLTAVELAALIGSLVALGAAVALTLACVHLTRLQRSLRAAIEEFRERAVPAAEGAAAAAEEAADAARRAGRQVDRLDDLIRTTGHVTETVDQATSATFRALANPVIKGAALASGTSRAARRLRSRGEADGRRRGA